MTTQLVTDALVTAFWRWGKSDALVHHSNRGSQYTSEQFQSLMADHGGALTHSETASLDVGVSQSHGVRNERSISF